MAGVQVIAQQQDPTAQAIAQSGQSIGDSIRQEQAIGLTARYYKTMQQNADTEAAREEWSRRQQVLQGMQQIKQQYGNNPQAAAVALKDLLEGAHQGDAQQGFQTVGDIGNDVQQRLSLITAQPGEGTQQQTQALQFQNAQRASRVQQRMYEQMGMLSPQGSQQGGTPAPGQNQGNTGGIPLQGQSSQGPMSSMLMTGIDGNGQPSFQNLNALAQIEGAKEAARMQAEAATPKVSPEQGQQLRDQQQLTSDLSDLNRLSLGVESAGPLAGKKAMLISRLSGGRVNPNIAQYMSQLPTTAVELYRAKTGATRISPEQAIAATSDMLWDPTRDSSAVMADKQARLADFLAQRNEHLRSGSFALSDSGQLQSQGDQQTQFPSGTPADTKAQELQTNFPNSNSSRLGALGGSVIPSYNPKTQKVQRNRHTGEYRVVNL